MVINSPYSNIKTSKFSNAFLIKILRSGQDLDSVETTGNFTAAMVETGIYLYSVHSRFLLNWPKGGECGKHLIFFMAATKSPKNLHFPASLAARVAEWRWPNRTQQILAFFFFFGEFFFLAIGVVFSLLSSFPFFPVWGTGRGFETQHRAEETWDV